MNIDPWSYVTEFEKALGEYTGAPYVITTDCATHAMELCLRYLNPIHPVQVPKHTYLSVPMMVEKIGAKLAFMNVEWEKYYQLHPYPVIDGSVHFEENCYVPGTFYCLSFQHKKRLNLGRGGAILTDNKEAYEVLKKMRYDGRDLSVAPWANDPVDVLGYHYYMTPEQAQKGLDDLSAGNLKPYEIKGHTDYPNLTLFPHFRKHNTEDVFHNGYHDFLYAWKPSEGKLIEIFVGEDGTTAIENEYDIVRDIPNSRKAPYLCGLLFLIYKINKNIIDHFTDDMYFFSINHNNYLCNANIKSIWPTLEKIKIFELEVLWSKIYPNEQDANIQAIKDWFIDNSNSNIKFKNLENVRTFVENNNIDVTYYTCETGLNYLNKDYVNELNFKIESFNFFLLTMVIEHVEYLRDPKYPDWILKGTHNPYVTTIELRKQAECYKILNLNRRPDYHRHLVAQSLLGKFTDNLDRVKVSWMDNNVKAYYEHPLNNGKSEYFNFEQKFLPFLSEEERKVFDLGEQKLRELNLTLDNDERNEESTLRYQGAVDNYVDIGLEIVSESIYFGPLGDVSEKALRPLVLGVPCIVMGGPESFKILERLGFKSYNGLTGYKDTERNNLYRFRSIIEFTNKLAEMNDEEYKNYMDQFYQECLPIIEHNQNNFKTGQVIENYITWIKEIHQ
jgi:hypothetical protein